MAQNMGLRLGEIGSVPLDVETYSVGGAVDAKDQFEAHQI
jgi:hypothetical protein